MKAAQVRQTAQSEVRIIDRKFHHDFRFDHLKYELLFVNVDVIGFFRNEFFLEVRLFFFIETAGTFAENTE